MSCGNNPLLEIHNLLDDFENELSKIRGSWRQIAKIIHEAAKALNFQVLVISHHSSNIFTDYSDRIFYLNPTPRGVKIDILNRSPSVPDEPNNG